jgi:hypothetical protein
MKFNWSLVNSLAYCCLAFMDCNIKYTDLKLALLCHTNSEPIERISESHLEIFHYRVCLSQCLQMKLQISQHKVKTESYVNGAKSPFLQKHNYFTCMTTIQLGLGSICAQTVASTSYRKHNTVHKVKFCF